MTADTDRQAQIVKAVETKLRDTSAPFLEGPLLDTAVRIWHDFADETDVSRTQKPETWAAALLYIIDQMQLGNNVSQGDVADWFDVSDITVSKKYREIADALDLTTADPRYLSDALLRRIERDFGRLPKDEPLTEVAGQSYWHLPFGFRDDDAYQDAQDLVYDGWDALSQGEVDFAEDCFEEALGIDDLLADAYNGLAAVALDRGDLEQAEEHYETAYDLARDTLGTEAPNAFYWWEEIDTRPYMRAREGLARLYREMGRYEDAAAEYESLLRLNPGDNQGARFEIGPLYQLAGNRDAALNAYEQYAETYPDDWGDPHHRFCWGLALFRDDQPKSALRRWREAIFQNVYVAPLLLDEPLPDTDVWHSINLGEPFYAEDYLDRYGTLWDEEARAALGVLWPADSLQEDLDEWLDLGRRLNDLADAARGGDEAARRQWRQLVRKQQSIEDTTLSNSDLRRLLKRMP
jgi:tetratricopeptide (TPR) repeat protein